MRIACANAYPMIAAEMDHALAVVTDGCRAINRVTTRGKSYSYPRYFFANESRDIMAIMG